MTAACVDSTRPSSSAARTERTAHLDSCNRVQKDKRSISGVGSRTEPFNPRTGITNHRHSFAITHASSMVMLLRWALIDGA
eukprot:12706689-Alexandrium_andersonii.AAC.1